MNLGFPIYKMQTTVPASQSGHEGYVSEIMLEKHLARGHIESSHPRMRIWAHPVTLGRFLPLGEPLSPHLHNGAMGLHHSGLAKSQLR